MTERLAICPWWRWPTVAGLTERQPSQMRLEGSVTEGGVMDAHACIMASSPPVVISSSGEPPAQSASQPALP